MKKIFLLTSIFLFTGMSLFAQDATAPQAIDNLLTDQKEESGSETEAPAESNSDGAGAVDAAVETVDAAESLGSEVSADEKQAGENKTSEKKSDPIVEAYLESEKKKKDDSKKSGPYKYDREKEYADARRPRKPDSAEIEKAASRDEKKSGEDYLDKCRETFEFGLEAEISDLLDELTKNEDLRFVDEIYDLFYVTKNPVIRNKILTYFTKLKDPCLCDYATEVINDPYDVQKDTVELVFKYAAEVECKEAVPGLIYLIDKEEEDYFNMALTAVGSLGGSEEALFLSDYLDRDDLAVAQKQSLMRVLGKIKAIDTWDKLSEIAQDEDENSYVRMYAAEAIGAMEKEESEEILVKLFEEKDPVFRQHVVRGISHFKDKTADEIILQALRDGQYKVRLEAIDCVKERDMKEAAPYLIYRCKDKSEEKVVKEKCYDVLAKLNTDKGNEFLISQIKDKKLNDTARAKVAAALLEYDHAGTDEIIEVARSTLKDDLRKNLRYALGKEFAKYGRKEFEDICKAYIEHSDVSTQGTGLDIWAKGRYSSLRQMVADIAKDAEESEEEESKDKKKAKPKKKNANAAKAKRILGIVDSMTGSEK
ncbi:HEAT repeat domain-containing protein [Treponema sp.]|uniref:HEAT repeat domain-containing protein n=1 Tax=Treponema sp. TaxID=166 RepID=UPI0025FADEDF|nr:HEAT repeat domain-containing protein [Treponema sp.]MCR5217383.1 HEAT repeat domain-containing protein [Treponema sp.]